MRFITLALCTLILGIGSASAEDVIGSVDTTFNLFGANDKVVVLAFDDPAVAGVTCYLSRARSGGLSGAFGIAEDKSDSSVACRQVGPISFRYAVPRQEDAFTQKASLLFKTIHVVRMVDVERNALVYLVYSDKLVDGSPKNSVTAVTVPRSTPIPVR